MTVTNKLNLPAGLVKAVSTERHNEPGCISATTLIKGVKEVILMDRHWEELADDVSDRIWAIFGTSVHSLLEQEGENEFTEQKMAYKIGNITVTGTIDNYDMKRGVICDYKTASVFKVKFGDFDDWYKQGMIYAWLLRKNGFDVHACRFIALLKDHSKTEMMRDRQYPRNPVYVYEFPVTFENIIKIDGYIRARIAEYEKCLALADSDIPECSPKERWEKASQYAVMKAGRKSAVRLLDDGKAAEDMAAELGQGYYVVTRQGESTKCRSYCLCREFCGYYRKSVMQEQPKPVKMEKQAA